MKIRNDFITNSSSTNFVFAFKGKHRGDLYRLMKEKYADFFLSMEEELISEPTVDLECNVNDIIEAIKSVVHKTQVTSLLEYIHGLHKRKIDIIRLINKNEHSEYMYRFVYEIESQIAMLNLAAEYGINKVLEVQFGDNHGHIHGTTVSKLMDYEGRNIKILSSDLVVLTEQMR